MIKYHYDDEKQTIYKTPGNALDKVQVLLVEGQLSSYILSQIHKKIISILKKADEAVGTPFRCSMMKKMEVVPNRIVFFAFQELYADNCRFLADKIIESGLDYEIIFIVKKSVYNQKDTFNIPPQVKLVRRNSVECFYALATARFWVDNALMCIWKKVYKKPNQIYIDTWHGSLGIKKLGGDKRWLELAESGNRLIDYFVTDSTFDEEVFSGSFWPDVKHLKYGHPRNDIFFDEKKKQEFRKKVYSYYHIPEDHKTVMYAPTFRDDKQDVSAILNLDFERLKHTLETRFGGKWTVICRLHFHNMKNPIAKNMILHKKEVIDGSGYPEMQELLAAVDVGITDYSSWIFDYLFTGRPAFIYAEDIDAYRNDRGFYYSLDETPFAIASGNDALTENILAFDPEVFAQKKEEFLKARGCYEDGKACERLLDFIVSHTEK